MTGKKSLRPAIIYVKNTVRVQEMSYAALYSNCPHFLIGSDFPGGELFATYLPGVISFANCPKDIP
jgi:hypothetical protein